MSAREWTEETRKLLESWTMYTAPRGDVALAAIAQIDRLTAEVERLKAQLFASYGVTEVWQRETLAARADHEATEAKLAEAQAEAARIVTLEHDVSQARIMLRAEREAHERTREALAAWRHSPSLPDCLACAVLDAHPGSGLRATSEEPKP